MDSQMALQFIEWLTGLIVLTAVVVGALGLYEMREAKKRK